LKVQGVSHLFSQHAEKEMKNFFDDQQILSNMLVEQASFKSEDRFAHSGAVVMNTGDMLAITGAEFASQSHHVYLANTGHIRVDDRLTITSADIGHITVDNKLTITSAEVGYQSPHIYLANTGHVRPDNRLTITGADIGHIRANDRLTITSEVGSQLPHIYLANTGHIRADDRLTITSAEFGSKSPHRYLTSTGHISKGFRLGSNCNGVGFQSSADTRSFSGPYIKAGDVLGNTFYSFNPAANLASVSSGGLGVEQLFVNTGDNLRSIGLELVTPDHSILYQNTGLFQDYSARDGTFACLVPSQSGPLAGMATSSVLSNARTFADRPTNLLLSSSATLAGIGTAVPCSYNPEVGMGTTLLPSQSGVVADAGTIRVIPRSPLHEFAGDPAFWSRRTGNVLAPTDRAANNEFLGDYIVDRFALVMRTLDAFQGKIEALLEYNPERVLGLLANIESMLSVQIEIARIQPARATVGEIGRGAHIQTVVSSLAQYESHEAEFAHVLFMDIVAYSKLTTMQQAQIRAELKNTVRGTVEFGRMKGNRDDLITRSTGDGMALVFFRSPEVAVRCAVQIGQALKNISGLKLRIGIHSGSVIRDTDINDQLDVAGGGINGAQRVMDCGDAGHILVSKIVAEFLKETGGWEQNLRDLGETTVKHGETVHLYNVVTAEAGNPETPKHYLLEQNKVNRLEQKQPN
jgi:class 3 adenylate cyclase